MTPLRAVFARMVSHLGQAAWIFLLLGQGNIVAVMSAEAQQGGQTILGDALPSRGDGSSVPKIMKEMVEFQSEVPVVGATAYLFRRGTSADVPLIRSAQIDLLNAGRYRVRAELSDDDRAKGNLLLFLARTADGRVLTSPVASVSGLKFAEFSPSLRCSSDLIAVSRESFESMSQSELERWISEKKKELAAAEEELNRLLTREELQKLRRYERELGIPPRGNSTEELLRQLSVLDALLTNRPKNER